MSKLKHSRRSLLLGFAGVLGGCTQTSTANAVTMTPSAAEGPFYPKPPMRMPDVDNDLVKVIGLVEQAGGEVFTLRGKITDRAGQALHNCRIEIWQCDVNGKYLHTGDRRDVKYDQAFQGFGFDLTDESGGYVFRTIKPTVYPGRAPHIHVKVSRGDRELLTTQFYIKGDALNARDGLFKRMTTEQADAVSMGFLETDTGVESTVDLVI